VQQGGGIEITLHGKIFVGDILAPLAEEWTGDADNL
jgi:hypothetical protein